MVKRQGTTGTKAACHSNVILKQVEADLAHDRSQTLGGVKALQRQSTPDDEGGEKARIRACLKVNEIIEAGTRQCCITCQ